LTSKIKPEGYAKIRPELEQLTQEYGTDRCAMEQILHKLQEKYHRIPAEHMQILADMLGIHAVEVQDVASFFHFYNTEEKGKYIIRMCRTMPCKMAGAAVVAAQLEKKLGIKFGENTANGKFTLEWTNCIGMCDQSPAFLINDKPYIKVKPKNIGKILRECK